MSTKKYGLSGKSEVEVDENGFVEVPVVVQESGMFAGAAPNELRITEILPVDEPEFNKQYVARLNRHTDLPYYLTTAKIKIVGKMIAVTDDDLYKEGIKFLS